MKIITNEAINERIEFLFTALQYCSQIKQTFTTGERIMINQERFQLLHMKTNPFAEERQVSNVIEAKLKESLKKIADYNYHLLNANPFKNESE